MDIRGQAGRQLSAFQLKASAASFQHFILGVAVLLGPPMACEEFPKDRAKKGIRRAPQQSTILNRQAHIVVDALADYV